MPLILQLAELDFQLLTQQIQRVLGRCFQDIIHPHKLGLILVNHTGQRRNTHLAIGKGIQSINRQIRTDPGRQLHFDFYILRRIVNDLLNLDLSVITRLDNTLNERPRCGAERNFLNQQR